MPTKQVKTSFIPTKPVQTVKTGGSLAGSGKKSNFFSIIAFIIFLATVVAAGGAFVYKLSLDRVVENQKQSLIQIQQAFDPALIDEAVRLNNRIESIKSLLENHTSPSQVFSLLEEFTLATVQFRSLQYNTTETGDIQFSVSGLADSFQSIVLQSDAYGDTGYLRDVLFTNLQPDNFGNVSFNLDGTVDGQFILYKSRLNSVLPEGVGGDPAAPGASQDGSGSAEASQDGEDPGTEDDSAGASFEFPEEN
jgi:hypothetical protein